MSLHVVAYALPFDIDVCVSVSTRSQRQNNYTNKTTHTAHVGSISLQGTNYPAILQ